MRDLASLLKPVLVVNPAVYTASQTPVVLDCRDANGVSFVIAVGVGGITFTAVDSLKFALEDSEDGIPFADVEPKYLNGTDAPQTVAAGGVVLSFEALKAAASLHEIGYIGGKKWLRATLILNGTHGTGTPVAVSAIKGHLAHVPG